MGRLKALNRWSSLAAWHGQLIPRRAFAAFARRVDDIAFIVNYMAVKAVLDIRGSVGKTPQTFTVAVVFGKQQFGRAFAVKTIFTKLSMRCLDRPIGTVCRFKFQNGFRVIRIIPAPGVAEPEGRQHMQAGFVSATIENGYAYMNFICGGFGILDLHIPVVIVFKHPGIEQAEGWLISAAMGVFLHQLGVGVFGLRIFVKVFKVAMARRCIFIKIIFLDILAMIALIAGETEGTFLENGIMAVP